MRVQEWNVIVHLRLIVGNCGDHSIKNIGLKHVNLSLKKSHIALWSMINCRKQRILMMDKSRTIMMTSSNGNIFHVTGPLSGEFTGQRWLPHKKDQWHGALMLSLICAWINGWVNNGEAGDCRRNCAHFDVIVIFFNENMRVCQSLWRHSVMTCGIISFFSNVSLRKYSRRMPLRVVCNS